MTREEFIALLKKKRYSCEMEGDKIMVTHEGNVDLGLLETLPPGVHFKNDGDVFLWNLETLPSGVEFKNDGNVSLSGLKSISSGVHFKNDGYVYLRSLETLPPSVRFENGGDIYLKGLGWVNRNEGIRIEGVRNKRLLNLMISKGLFI